MANEASVQSSLNLRILSAAGVTLQQYQSQPNSFTADVSMPGGPTPGEFLASKTGTQVVLTALTQPGLCVIQNLGVDGNGVSLLGPAGQEYSWQNYVEVGLYIPSLAKFVPLLELLPTEGYVLRLSRYLSSEFGGTEPGTGSEGSGIQLWVKAVGTACKVVVLAFER